ncbi:MAG: hypothetical protein JO064_06330 [Actinobacteria bacterium]|nr:hypothetical protein [Actinomycetota bacterium]MBV8599373.1 hypothetical protein [Actinomycetota bacterium]
MIATLVGFSTRPADQAAQGSDVILIMLLTGCVFLAVIALGELTRWAGHRRRDRKYGAHH